ncbi:MAG: MOSC domain-containing protein [Pseudomonadales bacterium]|nr:MOSC domain-containing protein [Pseudomonadales bacterium]
MIQITELNIYPIKSAGQISLESARLDRFGLVNDRRWMLVDPVGRFITQRELPRMSLLRVDLSEQEIKLEAVWMRPLSVPLRPAHGLITEVTVWKDQCNAIDMGNRVAEWMSQFLGRSCRLVYMPESTRRPVNPEYAGAKDTVSFADGFPLLLISEASLAELSDRLERPVEMNRFRPNIVVSGCQAFAEDSWDSIQINGIDFNVAAPCARCSMPTIDQYTGQIDREIMTTLGKFRRAEDRHIYFGQNLIHRGDGKISVADEVLITGKGVN